MKKLITLFSLTLIFTSLLSFSGGAEPRLAEIAERLTDSYDYIVAPKIMLDTPIQLSNMEKHDEAGNIIGHYSINELSQALGRTFETSASVDERFVKFRWSFDQDGSTAITIKYLEANQLINMRANPGQEKSKAVSEIDFSNLPPNAFGIFSRREIRAVPTQPAPAPEVTL